MPIFAGCLIGFLSWRVEVLPGSKCGKAKFIDAQHLLIVRSVEAQWFKSGSVAERPHFVVVGISAVT